MAQNPYLDDDVTYLVIHDQSRFQVIKSATDQQVGQGDELVETIKLAAGFAGNIEDVVVECDHLLETGEGLPVCPEQLLTTA